MKISFTLYCSDLEASFHFYQKVFNLKNETFTNKSKTFFVPIDDHIELKISILEKPLNKTNIEINEADIAELHDTLIKNQLSKTDESDPMKMQPGTFSGPWDFPGGNALFLIDPDNHFIVFTEW
jgi:catechol 2,3-dioxygenase-like lactoylglutathione lyase family enzyme